MRKNEEKKFTSIKIASILGILGNLFLVFIKGIIGLTTNSKSMIADAFNSAGDIFSSIMTFIGNKIASKPSDDDHNLGHGKAEYIYSMLISNVMIVMALKVLIDSVLSLILGSKYQFSFWLIIICIITIIVKFFLYIYTSKLYKKYNNLLLEANSKDHRNDMLITTVNLISCILSYYGFYLFDSLAGIAISIWILISAIQIFIKSYDVLMDKSMNNDTTQKVYEIIKRHDEVKKVIHFNSTPVGYLYQISFTIYVDGTLSTFESHAIADTLEKEIKKEIPEIYLTVIHVNPMKTKKDNYNKNIRFKNNKEE